MGDSSGIGVSACENDILVLEVFGKLHTFYQTHEKRPDTVGEF
jgi:hypothetical protein